MIIHFLSEKSNYNNIKVHFDLCEIEKELGISSVITFLDKTKIPKFFNRDVGKILNLGEALQLSKKDKYNLVIGEENTDVLDQYFSNEYFKVCYIQNFLSFNDLENYDDKFLWFISKNTKEKIGRKGFILDPFVKKNIFHPKTSQKFKKQPYIVLLKKSNGGKEASIKLQSMLPIGAYKDKIKFKVIEDLNEKDFAKELRNSDIYLSTLRHFDLSSLESFASDTLVLSFTEDLNNYDFLKHNYNSFLTRGVDFRGMTKIIWKLLEMTPPELELLLINGKKTVKEYNREKTKQSLINILRTFNVSF